MGLSRSLNTGTSSLRVHQQNLDVISNNIANVNTVGYKTARATFQDQFSQTLTYGSQPRESNGAGLGGVNPLQFGLGVKLGSVTNNMSQGILETTNRPLDMALEGDGFFVYNFNGRDRYSRAGAVSRDSDGYLVDSSTGAFLQGYNTLTDNDGNVVRDADGTNILDRAQSNLRIAPNILSQPKQTENVQITGNLSATSTSETPRQTSINIFDEQGGVHNLQLTFTKDDNTENSYAVSATIDGEDISLSEDTVEFNNDGSLNTPREMSVTAADLNSAIGSDIFDADTPSDITISLYDGNNPISGSLTQFAGVNTATASKQDGFQTGDLLSLGVDETGKIFGSFTNGQSELLGQVVIAKFTNPQGLIKDGGNFFNISPNSGLPNIGVAGETFESTTIAGGALESSNVDLTEEFTNMIKTQRAFEAASRTVTVSDTLLGETTNLKR